MSGVPECTMVKCNPFGVMVPLMRWCGVRACEVRGSPLGLLSVRAIFSSKRERCWYGRLSPPGPRLQGSSASGAAAADWTKV